ncbi:MAG: AAC(3) family N-acetyltransferase [Bacteroidales bacterium]|nr:AAC(3) family N-acetyltransferase [Bacteroidales bacterium]MCF8459038.1 AAC(3) family N-acetyltransferase [Bacteroidales bacterium]
METKIINTLVENWHRCGVDEGDVLLVHSSLKRLLMKVKTEFGESISPKVIYDSLLKALGQSGTLVLPLYNFDFPKVKFFDIRTTPSHMGALTEIGRNDLNSVRTGHPIYSFSIIGKHAKDFIGIDNKSGYGADSPFAKIKELDGKIAIIGLTDQNSMTSYHFVEEQNLVDYRYFKEFPGEYVDANGVKSDRTYLLYVRDLEKGVKTDVNRMMEYLWEIGAYTGDRHDEGYGMRTIDFNVFYNETDKIIKSGNAINYLVSIEK